MPASLMVTGDLGHEGWLDALPFELAPDAPLTANRTSPRTLTNKNLDVMTPPESVTGV
jgi:hypothetical protein